MNGMSREEIDGRFASSQATTDARIHALLERMDSVMVQSAEREARFNLQFDSAMEAIRDIRAAMRDIRAAMRDMRAEMRKLRAITDAAVDAMRSLARNVVIAVAVTCVGTGVATVFGVAAVNASISSSMLSAIETGSNMARNQEEFRRQLADIARSQAQLQQSQAQLQRQLADRDARSLRKREPRVPPAPHR